MSLSLIFLLVFLENEKKDPIQNELAELNDGLKFIKNEQDYMLRREEIHKQGKIIIIMFIND